MVQTNTVQGPGGEAGVMRIKGSGTPHPITPKAGVSGTPTTGHERGLAMALAGNSRWCYLDPKLGAMHAVAEAARKVACTGATPVAATNCLNFGNPEKPEIMAQLSAAIDGIAEACTALGTPITGGNVSLYNETRGEGIYPTPVIGVVGILDDVTKAVPADFQRAGDAILLLWPDSIEQGDNLVYESEEQFKQVVAERESESKYVEIQVAGSSEFARTLFGDFWGRPPSLNLRDEARLLKLMAELCAQKLIRSASDISDGGLAIALAKSGFPKGIGTAIDLMHVSWREMETSSCLFGELSGNVIISCSTECIDQIDRIAEKFGFIMEVLGDTTCGEFEISINRSLQVETTIADLRQPWSQSLESALHDQTANEVLA
jgi:phosphoribosylformylglycinamidine synthase